MFHWQNENLNLSTDYKLHSLQQFNMFATIFVNIYKQLIFTTMFLIFRFYYQTKIKGIVSAAVQIYLEKYIMKEF